MMASPPPLPCPQGQRGKGVGEGEGGLGCWAVMGGMSLQVSGHTLYWMPRKRHMAKIMAKSCTESRSWLVRQHAGPHRSPRAPLPGEGVWNITTHSCCRDSRHSLGGKLLSSATGLCVQCNHGAKGAWETKRHEFKPSSLLASDDLGPDTSLQTSLCARHSLKCFLRNFSQTRK